MLAGRDYKGLGFLLLLPVVAVALVMLILTVNIDPTSPTMTARLDSMLDNPLISVAAPPPLLSACLALERGGSGSCTGGHAFLQVPNVTDSYQLSQMLLKVCPTTCLLAKCVMPCCSGLRSCSCAMR